jgi:transposase
MEARMRRVIGIDVHRTFGEVVIWENGLTRHEGRVEMTRTALDGFGKQLLKTDEVVIEATGNCMAVSRVLSPHVKRVVIANLLQVKAIAYAHVKTDKVDAATLASLHAAGYLPEIWTPDAATERMRRLVARRYQVVRHRTRIKNEVHAILHAHLIPKCPHADLFNKRGRDWLARQPVPEDERAAITRHVRELERLGEDLAVLDRDIAQDALDDEAIRRLLTITGVNLAVAAALMAAIGSIDRFSSPQKLVSYFGLNPRVRQSGLGAAHHGRISKAGRSHARAVLVEAAWAAAKAPEQPGQVLRHARGEDQRASGRGRRPRRAGSLGGRSDHRARPLGDRHTGRAHDTLHDAAASPPMPGHGEGPRVKNGPALAGRGAEAVRDAIAKAITSLPQQLRRSLTWDQGAEMAKHADLRLGTGLEVYFCDPHSPWQRGSNENTNGLLRQYFPKGTDLRVHGADELAAVASALNGRPRKTLNWQTPAEALDRLLRAGHTETVATIG